MHRQMHTCTLDTLMGTHVHTGIHAHFQSVGLQWILSVLAPQVHGRTPEAGMSLVSHGEWVTLWDPAVPLLSLVQAVVSPRPEAP